MYHPCTANEAYLGSVSVIRPMPTNAEQSEGEIQEAQLLQLNYAAVHTVLAAEPADCMGGVLASEVFCAQPRWNSEKTSYTELTFQAIPYTLSLQ